MIILCFRVQREKKIVVIAKTENLGVVVVAAAAASAAVDVVSDLFSGEGGGEGEEDEISFEMSDAAVHPL